MGMRTAIHILTNRWPNQNLKCQYAIALPVDLGRCFLPQVRTERHRGQSCWVALF